VLGLTDPDIMRQTQGQSIRAPRTRSLQRRTADRATPESCGYRGANQGDPLGAAGVADRRLPDDRPKTNALKILEIRRREYSTRAASIAQGRTDLPSSFGSDGASWLSFSRLDLFSNIERHIMKTPLLLLTCTLLASLLASQAARAADSAVAAALAPSEALTKNAANGPVTRAEVRALARAAEQAGQIPRGEANWPDQVVAAPTKLSRAVVKAETRAAEVAGILSRGEAQIASTQIESRSTLDRATVKAEARLAEQRGDISRGESNLRQRS